MEENKPKENIVFQSTSTKVSEQALLAGMGIGFMPEHEAKLNPDIVEIFPPQEEWSATHWLVTHGDLHRTAKVQAFLQILKKTL